MAVVRSASGEYNSPERRSQRVMLKAPVVIVTREADNKTMFDSVPAPAKGQLADIGLVRLTTRTSRRERLCFN